MLIAVISSLNELLAHKIFQELRRQRVAQVRFLCFTADDLPWLVPMGTIHNIAVTVEPGWMYLTAAVENLGKEAATWLQMVATNTPDPENFWLSSMATINLNDERWLILLRFEAIKKAMLSSESFGVVGQEPLSKWLAKTAALHNIPFHCWASNRHESATWYNMKGLIRALALGASNFFRELTGWLFMRMITQPKYSDQDMCTYATFPRNWRISSESYSFRYTGNWPEIAQKEGKETAVLITLSRSNSTRISGLSQIYRALKLLKDRPSYSNKLIILERYGRLIDLLKAHGNPFKWLLWATFTRLPLWNGIEVTNQFRASLFQCALVDLPKSRYLQATTARALLNIRAKSLVLPVFELPDGRAATIGAHKAGIPVIGIQHGAFGKAHRWRAVDSLKPLIEIAHPAVPDTVIVEGPLGANWYKEAGIHHTRVHDIGSLRLPSIPENKPGDPSIPLRLLVLGDLHRGSELFRWCARHLTELSMLRIDFRPHPSIVRSLNFHLAQNMKIETIERPLIESIIDEPPLAVLANVSGACLEAALHGIPVGIIATNTSPDYNPLTAFSHHSLLVTQNSKEVIDWLKRLSFDKNFRRHEALKVKKLAQLQISSGGDEVPKRLNRIVASIISNYNHT